MVISNRPAVRIGPQLTPTVKYLIIACAAIFVWTSLASPQISRILGLVPAFFWGELFLWQAATYIFLHGDLWHLLINMFVLWMFGCELERIWGRREFLRFFLVTGVGAGLLSAVFDPFSQIPIIGASGAIYGLLMAFGMLFPERTVYLWFLIPIKVKYMVAGLAVIVLLSSITQPGSDIAHLAHLGGMLFGFLYLKGWLSPQFLRQSYHRWKIRRMRSRFEVHENPQRQSRRGRDDDFWIN